MKIYIIMYYYKKIMKKVCFQLFFSKGKKLNFIKYVLVYKFTIKYKNWLNFGSLFRVQFREIIFTFFNDINFF